MAEAAAKNFSVSATGGSGSAGQPAQYMPGEAYGEGGELFDVQTAAPMNKSGVVLPKTAKKFSIPGMEDIVPLDAPTQYPDEAVDMGTRAGTEGMLAAPAALNAQNDEDIARMAALLPIYQRIAESPNASNAMRNYYRYLRSKVQG
jgi:hypothetical protein